MNNRITAILNDDLAAVRKLLKVDPAIANYRFSKPKLFQSKIFHWIYVGDSALHLAAAGYRVEIVWLLLDAGADVNFVGKHRLGQPLHYAADGFITGPGWDGKRQVNTIETLVDAGADVNAQDKNGATPLHRAVRTRSAAAARCLLHSGCQAKLRNKPGSTAFHLAVQNTGRGGSGEQEAKAAQRQIIRDFISCGLKPSMKDGQGKTVADRARSPCIRELLSEPAAS